MPRIIPSPAVPAEVLIFVSVQSQSPAGQTDLSNFAACARYAAGTSAGSTIAANPNPTEPAEPYRFENLPPVMIVRKDVKCTQRGVRAGLQPLVIGIDYNAGLRVRLEHRFNIVVYARFASQAPSSRTPPIIERYAKLFRKLLSDFRFHICQRGKRPFNPMPRCPRIKEVLVHQVSS